MDTRIRYSTELDKIGQIPESQRIRAEARFLIIKEYEDIVASEEAVVLAQKIKKHTTVKAYCLTKDIHEETYYHWLKAYRDSGIEGLVPLFGTLSRGYKSIFSSKGRDHRKKKREKYIISVKIDFQVDDNSRFCLPELCKIIVASPLVSPEAKISFANAFKRICDLAAQKTPLKLKSPLTAEEKHRLKRYTAGNHKKHSAKATAVLMMDDGQNMLDIGIATNTYQSTVYKWFRGFNNKRLAFIETKVIRPSKIEELEQRKIRVVDIIHKMPALYGINRTSWTYDTIVEAYEKEYGIRLSTTAIKNTIKKTGYSWRHARRVLTSPDPHYKAKVELILDTLKSLKSGECFFFIDEVGPYRVRKYGGWHLSPPGETETIPEFQRSKGKVQFVAALEALSNQLTWLFTESKGSDGLVALLGDLVNAYHTQTRIYLTWDAIGVHSSRVLKAWISEHNQRGEGPAIGVVPLPANAQFLNVIEAVFGGMKRAVICNSDYSTVKEMQEAIRRHFEERNQFFKENPKRAGNKIWDKQSFDIDKLAGGLFKKM